MRQPLLCTAPYAMTARMSASFSRLVKGAVAGSAGFEAPPGRGTARASALSACLAAPRVCLCTYTQVE